MKPVTNEHRDLLNRKPRQVYASIVPERTTKPVVALHTQLSHAKNAVTAQGAGGRFDRARGGYPVHEAEVYQLVNDLWVLLYRVEEGTYPDDLPWK
jgi:hypothetical protein